MSPPLGLPSALSASSSAGRGRELSTRLTYANARRTVLAKNMMMKMKTNRPLPPLQNAIDRKALRMRSQGKKPWSSLRRLECQRIIGIPPSLRNDGKTLW